MSSQSRSASRRWGLAAALVLAALAGLLGWIILEGDGRRGVARIVPPAAPSATRTRAPASQRAAEEVSAALERIAAESPAEVAPSASPSPTLDREADGMDVEPLGGRLVVRVLRDALGEPMPDVRLVLRTERTPAPASVVHGVLQRGTPHDSLLTGTLGYVVFDAPSGERLRLSAWEEVRGFGYRELDVAALAPDEERSLTVVWERAPDLRLHGQVVDAVTKRPIARAEVQLRERGRTIQRAATDASGAYEFLTYSGYERYLRIDARNYGPRFEPALVGGRRIPLLRAARLQVSVTEGIDVPVEGAEVRVATSAAFLCSDADTRIEPEWEALEWTAVTNEKGRTWFAALPALAPLTLQLLSPSVQPGGTLRIQPNEGESVELHLIPPGTLRGRIVDRRGNPVANHMVWYSSTRHFDAPFFDCTCARFAATQTDAGGQFSLTLQQGTYRVGPARGCVSDPFCRPIADEAFAARAARVHVGGDRENGVELVVDRNLFLRGRVLDHLGHPFASARITVVSEVHGRVPDDLVLTFPDGRFQVGALERGAYRLQASDSGVPPMSGPEIRVRAGDDDIELPILPVRGAIRGFVVDATSGAGLWASVHAESAGQPHESESHGATGAFELAQLPPGEYTLTANSKGSPFLLLAPRRITLGAANGEVRGVTLPMLPAVDVVVLHNGRRELNCQVLVGGRIVLHERIRYRAWLRVPVGSVTFRLADGRGREVEHVIEIEPGRTEPIHLEFE